MERKARGTVAARRGSGLNFKEGRGGGTCYQTWANASALGSRGDRRRPAPPGRGPDEVEAVGVASTWRAGSPDGEIFTLALPALFSVLIDPLIMGHRDHW